MFLALLQFDLFVDGAMGLKDKRRVVKSLKDKLHREHMVSVAEVGSQELWNRATIGLACVGSDGAYLRGMLDRITGQLRSWPDARLGSCTAEVIPVEAITRETDEDGSPLWTEDERREDRV